MTIEIHEPELEALINERMQAGAFQNVQDLIFQTLKATSVPKPLQENVRGLAGSVIVAAMQACPHKDFDFEPYRPHEPVRDLEF